MGPKTAIRSSEGRQEEARGVLQDGVSKIEHTARLRAATLASAASRLPFAPPENGAWRSGEEICSVRDSCACRPRNAFVRRWRQPTSTPRPILREWHAI